MLLGIHWIHPVLGDQVVHLLNTYLENTHLLYKSIIVWLTSCLAVLDSTNNTRKLLIQKQAKHPYSDNSSYEVSEYYLIEPN